MNTCLKQKYEGYVKIIELNQNKILEKKALNKNKDIGAEIHA